MKEPHVNNPAFDKFCKDYDKIFDLNRQDRDRIKILRSRDYTDDEIYEGRKEYKNRVEQERINKKLEKKNINIPDLIELSVWKGDKENITFDDIIGLEKAKKILNERFDEYYKYHEKMIRYNVEPSSGLGLHGVPGVGKSLLMKAILNKAKNINKENPPLLLYISIADLLSGKRGEIAKTVKLMFDNIRNIEKLVIICIDEIDMIMRGKNDTNSVLTRELTSIFLQQWDGSGNIFVVFTTNNLNDIEEAFLNRLGYDNCAKCDIPNYEERKLIIEKYLKFPLSKHHIDLITELTTDYVGRDIKKLGQPLFILSQEKNPLLDSHIKEKIDEINDLKNETIKEMFNTNKHKNKPSKFKGKSNIIINTGIVISDEIELRELFDN